MYSKQSISIQTIQIMDNIHLLYKAEKPSVRLSVLSFWHTVNSAVCPLIETELARNEKGVFEEHKVYFFKPV